MKKFISMVMAAAMVVSLVPATAFAAGDVVATAKIVDAIEMTKDGAQTVINEANFPSEVPELQLKVKSADYRTTVPGAYAVDVTVSLDGAEFDPATDATSSATVFDAYDAIDLITIAPFGAVGTWGGNWANFNNGGANVSATATGLRFTYGAYSVDIATADVEDDEFTFTINGALAEDDMIYVDLISILDKATVGFEATVDVDSDMVEATDLVYASVLDYGIKASVKKVADVAEDEVTALERDLKIESAVGRFDLGQVFELKLNKGFEFDTTAANAAGLIFTSARYSLFESDEKDVLLLDVANLDEISVAANLIRIDAENAKAGDVATITVKALKDTVMALNASGVWVPTAAAGTGFSAKAEAVEVAKVVEEGIFISVDADEDVPVYYAGVNHLDTGLTSNEDHESVTITLEETVVGAYDDNDEIEFVLPEGVFVVEVEDDNFDLDTTTGGVQGLASFLDAAYEEGDHKSMVIEDDIISETAAPGNKIETEFILTLVAAPDFEGDVTLTMLVDGEKVSEVVIAKFVPAFTIEAQANDLVIDYRNTVVPTDIVIKEAEAGLWDRGLEFTLSVEEIEFDADPEVTINEESEMEVDVEVAQRNSVIELTVDEKSDEEAAVITISDIELYMERNLPAGAYDLELSVNAAHNFLLTELWTIEPTELTNNATQTSAPTNYVAADVFGAVYTVASGNNDADDREIETYTVAEWYGYIDKNDDYDPSAMTVKEGFVNIITAGRDQDDASFTTKVVVPVGEKTIIAGEATVELDVPAYINANGYTMLPVRAVAVALGIKNDNVLWDQATKTVTILYGQRIITMTAGQKVVNVNGSAIPASASVEIVDGRTFLGMRDLATALGVTDITWDQATKTATLNGNA